MVELRYRELHLEYSAAASVAYALLDLRCFDPTARRTQFAASWQSLSLCSIREWDRVVGQELLAEAVGSPAATRTWVP
jgi:hypothetical protein